MYKSILFHILLWVFTFFRVVGYCGSYEIWECSGNALKVTAKEGTKEGIIDRAGTELSNIRVASHKRIKKHYPSPHSELLGGILLGVNDIKNTPTFNDVVRDVGTIHVIVVSGYNINLVFAGVYRIIGTKYKARNTLLAITATFIYAVISGFDPPVIRAWIMGSIVGLGAYYGRKVDVTQILWFSGIFIVAVSPAILFSLSFQLSFLATLGLICYADIVSKMFNVKNTIFTDLSATLAAQLLVWPLIAYHFDRVSIISPLVNSFVLWLVPISTVMGGLYLAGTFISSTLGSLISYVVMVPLDLFIRLCFYFSQFPYSNITFSPTRNFLLVYYACILLMPYAIKKRDERKESI